jgi:cytochrome oxidase Cu insertion factor (SCO1/SenC/PrrC family)
MWFIPTIALVAGLLLGALEASSEASEVLDQQPGLKLGAKAPAFTLLDQSGKERSLSEFVKKGKVALVFFRSASW